MITKVSCRDLRNGALERGRQLKCSLSQLPPGGSGRAKDRAIFVDHAGQATPMTGAGARSALSALAISFSIMPMSSSMVVLLLACHPHVARCPISDLCLGEVGFILQVQLDYAHADIGAADVDGEDRLCGPSASRRA